MGTKYCSTFTILSLLFIVLQYCTIGNIQSNSCKEYVDNKIGGTDVVLEIHNERINSDFHIECVGNNSNIQRIDFVNSNIYGLQAFSRFYNTKKIVFNESNILGTKGIIKLKNLEFISFTNSYINCETIPRVFHLNELYYDNTIDTGGIFILNQELDKLSIKNSSQVIGFKGENTIESVILNNVDGYDPFKASSFKVREMYITNTSNINLNELVNNVDIDLLQPGSTVLKLDKNVLPVGSVRSIVIGEYQEFPLEDLDFFANLKELYLHDFSAIKFNHFPHLNNLELLSLFNVGLADFDGFPKLAQIKRLMVFGSKLLNFSAIPNLNTLIELSMMNTDINIADGILKQENITILNIVHTPLANNINEIDRIKSVLSLKQFGY